MNPVKVNVDNVLSWSGEGVEKAPDSAWVAGGIVGAGENTPLLSKGAGKTDTFAACDRNRTHNIHIKRVTLYAVDKNVNRGHYDEEAQTNK